MSRLTDEVSLAVLAGGSGGGAPIGVPGDTVGGTPTSLESAERVAKMLRAYAPLFAHAYVVADNPDDLAHLGAPVIAHALSGERWNVALYTAALAAPTEKVLCLDTEAASWVSGDILRLLARESRGYDIAVAVRHGTREPGCAVYARSLLPALRAAGDRKESSVDDLWAGSRTRFVEMEAAGLGNMEQPEPQKVDPISGRPNVSGGMFQHLTPRIRRFMEAVPYPVVSFVGKKKTGKTTVLVRVVTEMVARGYRVAIIKHDQHGFDADVPGTDTYRLREAGAIVTGISSPDKQMWIVVTQRESGLMGLIGKVDEPVDLVITEGFKRQDAPKIEVARRERSENLICSQDELIGVVSDMTFDFLTVPQMDLNDTSGICDLLETAFLCRPGGQSAPIERFGP